MNITNSNDITVLAVKATWDISNITPQILIENLSQGPNLAGMSWAFVAKSPTGTFIHDGDINSPDITGAWTDYQILAPWPRPFNSIEWSGAPYTLSVIAKDSDGNTYQLDTTPASICKPAGNNKLSKNAYGLATVYMEVKCADGRVFFQDTTNAIYKGLEGTQINSLLRVIYPIDETGTIPTPFALSHFATALVPITYSSDNYQYMTSSIYDYELAEDVFVRIRYQSFNPRNGSPAMTFAVLCNIDLCPLMCEVDKLIADIESGRCKDVEAAEAKLIKINPLLWMIGMGIQQPLCGVDVPGLIEQVKLIGGFDCNCCNAATGVIPAHSSIIDGYNFQIVSVCGDISGTVEKTGTNIQFLLQDKKYVFKICENSPPTTTAFQVVTEESGDECTKTYCLQIDGVQLAEDILNNIKNNADLVNLFNTIVTSNGSFTLIVDGKCIFSSSSTCDYTLFLSNIPEDTTFALLTAIKIGSTTYPLNFSFNQTNVPALQTYLNSLGYGTFVCSISEGGVLITSTANGNDIQQLIYKISGTTYLADLSKECTGYVPLSANQVVHAIIDYLCDLDDSQIVTSGEYTICYLDPTTGTQMESVVAAGTALATFITELLARGCDTVTVLATRPPVNCDDMKTLFGQNVLTMQPNDYFFGTKEAICSQITPLEAFLKMLQFGLYNEEVKTAFCALVEACAGGNPCAPFSSFFVDVEDASPGIDLVVNFTHPDAIKFTIAYARIDNTVTPVFTTIFDVLPGDSPYTIAGVTNGQYRVRITPIYADGRSCNYTQVDTPACTGITSLSAVFTYPSIIVSYSAIPTINNVRLTVAYSNGGFFTGIYANDGNDITVTPPVGVYGSYQVTMQPVCDEDSEYYGASTAPVVIEVFNPTVIIANVNPGGGSANAIMSVTGISGYAISGQVSEGEQQVGVHNAFTGQISVSIYQPALSSNHVKLLVNGVEVECLPVSQALLPQTYTFASGIYTADDVIEINFDYGVCETSPPTVFVITGAGSDSELAACAAASVDYYSDEELAIGTIIYTDEALTTPLVGVTIFADHNTGILYNIDSLTGEILSITGNLCAF